MAKPWSEIKHKKDNIIVRTLKASSLSDLELAEKLGVSVPTIMRWRSGLNLPEQAMREAILEKLKA